MKVAKSLKGLLLGLALLLAVSAFASNKGSVSLSDSVIVGNQTLKPGDYSVKWDGNGPNVQLSIMKGSKVVATAPARLVDMNQPYRRDAAVTQMNADGSKSLIGLRLAGKRFAIEIGQESALEGTK
jgi:hypothetical protein